MYATNLSFRQSSFKEESPPSFLGEIHAAEDFNEAQINCCLATTYYWSAKRIAIDLWEEGLDV